MIVVRESATAPLAYRGASLRVLLDRTAAGASQAMLGVVEVAPGARLPEGEGFSIHPCEEYAYVLSGTMVLWAEGREVTLQAGDAVFLRPGERHWVANPGSVPTRALFVLSPPTELAPAAG